MKRMRRGDGRSPVVSAISFNRPFATSIIRQANHKAGLARSRTGIVPFRQFRLEPGPPHAYDPADAPAADSS